MANPNSGKEWSALDLSDLEDRLCLGTPIEELADFLCRNVEEVRAKAAEQQKGRAGSHRRGQV